MAARKTLYLLRQPIRDSIGLCYRPPKKSTWPELRPWFSSNKLWLRYRPFRSVYVLSRGSNPSVQSESKNCISYRDLVTLIAEHERTIVL